MLLSFGTLARQKNSDNVVLMWKLKVFRDMIRMSADRNRSEWMQFDETCKNYLKPNSRYVSICFMSKRPFCGLS